MCIYIYICICIFRGVNKKHTTTLHRFSNSVAPKILNINAHLNCSTPICKVDIVSVVMQMLVPIWRHPVI